MDQLVAITLSHDGDVVMTDQDAWQEQHSRYQPDLSGGGAYY